VGGGLAVGQRGAGRAGVPIAINGAGFAEGRAVEQGEQGLAGIGGVLDCVFEQRGVDDVQWASG
jgi:hypothetical protein